MFDQESYRLHLVVAEGRERCAQRDQHVRPSRTLVLQRDPQHLDTGAVVTQQLPGGLDVDRRTELEHHCDVVGQLIGLELGSALAVGLLELHQHHSATASVAVREVGEVQTAAPGVIEGLDEVGLQVLQWHLLRMVEEGVQRIPHCRRQIRDGRPDHRALLVGVVVRVFQQQRHCLPDDAQLILGQSRTVALGHPAEDVHHLSFRPGKSPRGLPLPSQLSRFTRPRLVPPPTSSSLV